MECPICHKNKAIIDDYYGVLPCEECQDRQASLKKAGKQTEMVGEDIRQQRKAYITDIRPAHRKGQLDKGFVERYGAKAAKLRGFSDEEIKKAKYVWDGDDSSNSYYKKGN